MCYLIYVILRTAREAAVTSRKTRSRPSSRSATELGVQGCGNLTEDSIKAILAKCPSLKEFRVPTWDNITEEFYEVLEKSPWITE